MKTRNKFLILTAILIFSGAILFGCGESEQPTVGSAPEERTTQPPAAVERTEPPATAERPAETPPAAEQPSQPPAVAEQPSASQAQPSQQSQAWIGRDVMGSDNQKLGTVSDVYLLEGNVRYVIIQGEGEKLHPVPVDQLREEGQSLTANFDRNTLQQAPSFSKTEEPRLAEAEWEQQIRGYYEKGGAGGGQQPQSGQSGQSDQQPQGSAPRSN